jgi:hypothetical protein
MEIEVSGRRLRLASWSAHDIVRVEQIVDDEETLEVLVSGSQEILRLAINGQLRAVRYTCAFAVIREDP